MTILMPDLIKKVLDGAQSHFPWCNLGEHDYETPEHEAQLCKSSSTVRFPHPLANGDDVLSFEVELAGSRSDVAHHVPVPLASLAFNGQIPGWDMEPWKLIPLAMTLLSAEARSRGDAAMEGAYLDAANAAIDAHVIEQEDAEPAAPVYVVAEGPQVLVRDRHSYDHIEDDMAGAPRYVVQHTTPGHWQLLDVQAGTSVDGIDYTSFETARNERDLRNAEVAR